MAQGREAISQSPPLSLGAGPGGRAERAARERPGASPGDAFVSAHPKEREQTSWHERAGWETAGFG